MSIAKRLAVAMVLTAALTPAVAATLNFTDVSVGLCWGNGPARASGLLVCDPGVPRHDTTPALTPAGGGGGFSLLSISASTRAAGANPDGASNPYGQVTDTDIARAAIGAETITDHIEIKRNRND